MKKLSYALGGAGIAGFLGLFFGCFINFGMDSTTWGAAFILALFGAIIGFFIGLQADREEKLYQERKRQEKERQFKEQRELEKKRQDQLRRQAQEQRYQEWADQLHLMFQKIEKNVGPGYDPREDYDAIWKIRDPRYLDSRQEREFERQLSAHSINLHRKMSVCMLRQMGIGGLAQAVFVADCLAIVEPDVRDNVTVAKVLRETLQVAMQPLCYITFSGYGECEFPLDNEGEMERIAENANKQLDEFKEIETQLRAARQNIVQVVIKYISPELIEKQCMLMWYYAKLKPFDVNRFEDSRFAFLTHTALYCKDPGVKDEMKAFSFGGEDMKVIALGKVEEVLARIYSKNQIGGVGTVRQEKDYIDFWLDQRIKSEDYEDCYLLASGLAWMELYELELDVLRKLVASDVQLPVDMQERLSFLESGGTANIKLYDVNPSEGFYFDNSSIDWKAKEFAVFFRKMAMKKIRVKYSIAISKWTKTLPLVSGQKVSKSHLYQEFLKLVEDFDGEITCQETNAVAVNLANVAYPDAILFSFTSERNRCVSVLFSCEKYGRNLNLTILTLFTPEEAIPFDQLEKYCLAIKDNVYVESFRESILQVVDDAIKVKQSVYEDDEMPRKKAIFAEED